MIRLITVFAFVGYAFAGFIPDFGGRIVNGNDTTIEEHPYQVSLQLIGRHFCGGSIISKDIIVTAAHCVKYAKPGNIKVRLGSTEHNNGGKLVDVKALKYHEEFDDSNRKNDVAVIKLSTPLNQSSVIRYIKLADSTPDTGTPAVVTGWGKKCYEGCVSFPKILQAVEVNMVSRKLCASSMYKYGSQIKETMVCANAVGKDACIGDTGGPLVSNNRLVGIVSWGIGCASPDYPGVYCDVASMRNWIEKTAKEL